MAILRAAFQALQQNYGPLLFYIGVAFAVYSARLSLDTLVIAPRSEEITENILRLYSIAIDIVAVAVVAMAQTIAFSRMGREIDKPMWRVADDLDAVRLFYKLWLLLGLVNVAAVRFRDILFRGTEEAPVQLILVMMWLLGAVLLIFFGSAVMFYGRVGRQEVTEAVTTMARQLPYVLLIATVGFFFRLFLINLQLDLPLWARPALAIADGYLDCFLFASMWLVCIYHRDEYDHPDDDDFDF
ncbi:MAG: hypothetical protein QGD90_05125 [Candidatus Hydrogenedentes bacterium]|nr:hypothetical protein [Candidatus Hydrogenedentota bacterium]